MRIAVAVFGQEVSPRWCGAPAALIATVRDGSVVAREVLPLADCSNTARLGKLHARGVSVLVCGGFDRRYLSLAERLGVRVVWGVTGSAEEALGAFVGASTPNATLHRPEERCGYGPRDTKERT
jgi:predicted Fe-Mo cluster-binding NifX family protein